MSRITGVVSRTIPLDPIIGRPFSLSGTFDLYVSASELVLITPVLDSLVASNILTTHQRFVESDSLIANVTSPVVDSTVALGASPYPLLVVPIAIPDAATQTYTYTALKKFEIVDVIIHKVGAGASNTIAVQDASAAAITNAIAADTANGRTSAGTIDRTKNVVSAGATFKILATKVGGTMTAEVHLVVVLR